MKTKTLLTIIAGFLLLIAGGLIEIMLYYKDDGSFIQGLSCGVLVGGILSAFADWKVKRATPANS